MIDKITQIVRRLLAGHDEYMKMKGQSKKVMPQRIVVSVFEEHSRSQKSGESGLIVIKIVTENVMTENWNCRNIHVAEERMFQEGTENSNEEKLYTL